MTEEEMVQQEMLFIEQQVYEEEMNKEKSLSVIPRFFFKVCCSR